MPGNRPQLRSVTRPAGRAAAVLFAALALVAAVQPAGAADFVGAEACRSCHPSAYEAWRRSAHARALDSLSREQRRDARCLQCHARDLAAGGEAGVTCETCHGAGEYYWPAYVMRDAELARATGLVIPDGKSCTSCHDGASPALAPFDLAAALARIDHWTEARAQRRARSEAPCPRGGPAQKSAAARPAGSEARPLFARLLSALRPRTAER